MYPLLSLFLVYCIYAHLLNVFTLQIGKGGYGDVFLARKADTQELCALKRMRKAALVRQDEVHSTHMHT